MNLQPIHPPNPVILFKCISCGTNTNSLKGYADLDSVNEVYCRICAEIIAIGPCRKNLSSDSNIPYLNHLRPSWNGRRKDDTERKVL